MIETISPFQTKETENSLVDNFNDSTVLFRLALELYYGESLSDSSREFLDSMVPEPAIVLLIAGKRYLHPDNFETVPIRLVRDSVIENRAGIYRRRLHDDFPGTMQSPELCASLIGKNRQGEDVAAGILYPNGWNPSGINEDLLYCILSKLRSYYGEFISSSAVSKLTDPGNMYHYAVDSGNMNVIASAEPEIAAFRLKSPDGKPRLDEEVEALLQSNFETSDESFGLKLKNLQISNFSLQSYKYSLISFEPAEYEKHDRKEIEGLLSHFSHRLNNKLGALTTAADQLASELGETVDEDDVELADIIKSECAYVNRMVYRFSDYIRSGEITLSRLNLVELIRDILSSYKGSSLKRGVEFNLQHDNVEIVGDREQLKTAFKELLDNAVENGKIIKINIARNPRIEISINNDLTEKRYSELTSESFDPFEPFLSLDNRRLGMGLPVAKKIIERNSGTIEFKPEPSTGLTVTVTFPEQS